MKSIKTKSQFETRTIFQPITNSPTTPHITINTHQNSSKKHSTEIQKTVIESIKRSFPIGNMAFVNQPIAAAESGLLTTRESAFVTGPMIQAADGPGTIIVVITDIKAGHNISTIDEPCLCSVRMRADREPERALMWICVCLFRLRQGF